MSEISDAAQAAYPDDEVHAISRDEWREAFESGAKWAASYADARNVPAAQINSVRRALYEESGEPIALDFAVRLYDRGVRFEHRP